MDKFITVLAQLPEERQKAIKEGLQNQIIAQAEFVRDEQPARFVAYIDDEIAKADASMLKMVEESSHEGAILSNISEIFIWNKERKRALARLKDAFLQPQLEQHTEPQRGELRYYCEKAVEMGYKKKEGTGYRRVEGKMTKAQLAYMLGFFLNSDNNFPEKEYDVMFSESRLSKANSQLANNKNGYGKPKGYEKIDELLNK